ncbi:hypothetical protein [Pseudaquidulcibacter saccharophilus]|uniref:hypothetical protein n=1 Tax=Pseudaquidulcibacter saccharophilus TaxID=2831900 RepID=UPI001EFEF734|nr:hypothetical protein [Pseudaquidulcibacter saccharophilus]
MQLDFLHIDSLTHIAWALFDVHGENALSVADNAICELEDDGSYGAADAWRSVKTLIEDVVCGRIDRESPTIH